MELSMWPEVPEQLIRSLTAKMAPHGTPAETQRWQHATKSNGADMALAVHPCSWRQEVPQMVTLWPTVWAVCTGLDWGTQCLVEIRRPSKAKPLSTTANTGWLAPQTAPNTIWPEVLLEQQIG